MSVFNTLKGMLPVEVTDALGDEITRSDSIAEQSYASQTVKDLHIYVNSSTGLDTNDGLTENHAKQTLAGVRAILPTIINHFVVIHMRGTFSESVIWDNVIGQEKVLLFDGGSDKVVINAGGTATISSTSSIGITGAGWTPNAWQGYQVEILSGPAEGQTRSIQTHTSDTITPSRNWSTDPGAASFRIVRPATSIDGGAGLVLFQLDTRGTGYTQLQQVYVPSGASLTSIRTGSSTMSRNTISLSGVVFDNSSALASTWLDGWVTMTGALRDPSSPTLASMFSNTDPYVATSFRGSTLLELSRCVFQNNGLICLSKVTLSHCQYQLWNNGSWLEQVELVNTKGYKSSQMKNQSGYATTTVSGSSGVGITLDQFSSLEIASGTISNHGSHAIEVRNHSHLWLNGVIPGTGSTGAGVYIHRSSSLRTKVGSIPTLTGTIGHLSFDGSSQRATWTTLNGAPQLETTTDIIIAKAL